MDSTEATAHDQPAGGTTLPDNQARPLTAEEQYQAEVEAALAQPADDAAPQGEAPAGDEAAPGTDGDPNDEADKAGDPAAPATTEDSADKPKDEDEDDAPAGTSRRFRLQANDPVEARAFELRKHNRDLSLEECLARAKAELTPEGDQPAEDGNAMPATVDAAHEALTALRAERKKAFGEDYDFAKAAELDDKIEELRAHIATLSSRETVQQEQEKERFMATVEESKAQAVDLYPDVSNPDSALVKRMEEIDADMRDSDNPLYFDPQKPFKLAQMAANDLSIAPRSRAKAPAKPAASQQPTRPARPTAPIVPASGNARTTNNQPNKPGELLAEVDRVNDPASYEKLVAAL